VGGAHVVAGEIRGELSEGGGTGPKACPVLGGGEKVVVVGRSRLRQRRKKGAETSGVAGSQYDRERRRATGWANDFARCDRGGVGDVDAGFGRGRREREDESGHGQRGDNEARMRGHRYKVKNLRQVLRPARGAFYRTLMWLGGFEPPTFGSVDRGLMLLKTNYSLSFLKEGALHPSFSPLVSGNYF
jgi:hypothetical protein